MARMFSIASLMGAVAIVLGGCSFSSDTGSSIEAQTASSTAACNGQIRAFGDSQTVATTLTCAGSERPYVAYADNIAHRFSPCAYTFEPASGGTGSGQMSCSNGASGPLTYDMTDATNIKVVASLDDGRQMAFTLRDQ